MQILTFNFLICTISGLWRPIEWSSAGSKLLYSTFSAFVLVVVYFFMITQFLDIALVVDNVDDLVATSLTFVSLIAVCCKATIVVVRRDVIVKVVQMLLEEPCKPEDENEMTIQMKFDELIRYWSIRYLLLAMTSFSSATIGSVFNIMQGLLPYRTWLPYNSNISLLFWVTSMQQVIALFFSTIINIGVETLVFGLILQTCAQLEIFEYRLQKLITNKTKCMEQLPTSSNKNKAITSKHICHHLNIYKYAKTVNIIFNEVLFVQFFGSILVLCTSIYYLSSHTSSQAVFLLVYTACMFVQIYLYCWSGNEVMLKSTSVGDAIYCMDWPVLSVRERKELMVIMIRSTIPIKFTSSFLITLNLQSYSNILKTSYSAYNVLQQS